MILLVRPAEPDSLTRNRTQWTNRWINIRETGGTANWATPAAKSALRNPLLAFSRGKCAFCEERLRVTSYMEIEHYHAKTVQPALAFEWRNLFPACRICNGTKGELDHAGLLLRLDEEDPEPLLWLDQGTGELEPHPSLAPEQARRVDETTKAYGLKRGELCARRIEMIERVNEWLASVENQVDITPASDREWKRIVDPYTPLKFVIRHVLARRGQAQLAEVDRQAFLHQP